MKISIHLNFQYIILFVSFIILDFISENNFFREKSYKYYFNPSIQISLIILSIIEWEKSALENKSLKKETVLRFEKEQEFFPMKKIVTLIICDNIFNYVSSYLINKKVVGTYAYFFDIIFVFIIDILIFKKEMHNHHFLSTILNIISCIIYIYYFSKEILKLFVVIYIILNCYTFYFSLILIKYLNTKYFVNIYFLGSLFGLVRLFVRIIEREVLKINTSNIVFAEWYYVISYCIVKFLWNYLYFIIVYKLDSPHIVIFQFIVISHKSIELRNNIIIILTSLISILSGLIYTEILELNFCKLSANTKIRIDKRAKFETDTIFKEFNIIDLNENNIDHTQIHEQDNEYDNEEIMIKKISRKKNDN